MIQCVGGPNDGHFEMKVARRFAVPLHKPTLLNPMVRPEPDGPTQIHPGYYELVVVDDQQVYKWVPVEGDSDAPCRATNEAERE
jgi:hypothetical protein